MPLASEPTCLSEIARRCARAEMVDWARLLDATLRERVDHFDGARLRRGGRINTYICRMQMERKYISEKAAVKEQVIERKNIRR